MFHVYIMDKESDDLQAEETLMQSFKIADYFASADKLVYGKAYEFVMSLWYPDDEEIFTGNFGENELEADQGADPYFKATATLNTFNYEVKEVERKPRAGRASRSPQRARSPRDSTGILNKNGLKEAV